MSWHSRVMQNLKKNWFVVWKMINFHGNSRKSENLHLDGLLFSIAYKVSIKKVQNSYLSWHWRVIQTLKQNLLFLWKMTWGIWWILTQAEASLKICTWMGHFCWKYVMFEPKSYRVLSWKMTYGFKNDIRNFVNFHTSSWK